MAQLDIPATVKFHPWYEDTVIPLRTVRDCVEGEWKIKNATDGDQGLKGTRYLSHPSDTDKTTAEAKARYIRYRDNAEYMDYVNTTLRGWLGKMRISAASVKVPDRLEYLLQNVDGDGTPLLSAVEHSTSNVYQANYHIIAADFKGLQGVDLRSLSTAQTNALNPRAVAKQYTRESLVDWDYRRINGVMQLSYLKFKEHHYDFNADDNTRALVETDIILALDEQGSYYQKKIVGGQEGDRDYVKVKGQPLKWLPVAIVGAAPLPVGALPRSMGMLYPICRLALERYNVSAIYKEAMRYLVPTTFTSGWKPNDKETFQEVNGRDQMAWGPGCANNLPEGVTVEVKSGEAELSGFERYFENNLQDVRALGGIIKNKSESTRTATEADIDASELNAALESVAEQQEQAWKRIIAYCGMFENLWSPDEVESKLDKIVLDLPRDFATPKLSVEEVVEIRNLYVEGMYTKQQAVSRLHQGGWDTGEDLDVWLSALEEAEPSLSGMADRLPREPVQPTPAEQDE